MSWAAVLTKRKRPMNRLIAAIVPLRNVDRETLALSTHHGFLALIESRRQVAAGKTLSLAEMRAAVKRRRRTSRSRRRRRARRA